MSKKSGKLLIYLPIIVSIAVVVGFILGANVNGTNTGSDPSIISFKHRNFNILNEIINYIDQEYVDTVRKDELIEETVQHLLQELDPHSYYIPASELKAMNEPLEGKFEGIGVQFNIQKDTVVIITTISGGPSEKVGLQAGDRIVKVDGELIAGNGITNQKVMKLLKGKKGTKVNLTVDRFVEKNLDFTITRDKIPFHSVDVAYMLNKDIGFIKISRFAKTTYQEFMEATQKLTQQGMSELVIDLRGNGGGFLDAAVRIADELLPKGKMIVYTEGRARDRQNYYSEKDGAFQNFPIAVLIDQSSASASEILAGAIQDNDRGEIIGRRSFGKGLVQEQTNWPDGSATRLTIARYYTPTGRCIQRPYGEGTDQYLEDFEHRYETGELYNADTIDFPDSLKFTTPGGKIVYGGGGIMPDFFVPIDTSGGSFYLNKVVYRGLVYDYAFDYVDKNRTEIENLYKSSEEFQENIENKALLSDFIEFAKKKGIEGTEKEINRSEKQLLRRLKAYIARNVWNNEGFYRILNTDDEVVIKTKSVLKQKDQG